MEKAQSYKCSVRQKRLAVAAHAMPSPFVPGPPPHEEAANRHFLVSHTAHSRMGAAGFSEMLSSLKKQAEGKKILYLVHLLPSSVLGDVEATIWPNVM